MIFKAQVAQSRMVANES